MRFYNGDARFQRPGFFVVLAKLIGAIAPGRGKFIIFFSL